MTIAQNNFPVTFSVLSANALKDCVLSFYDIGPITACKLYYMGLNDTYVVQTVNYTYMLRAYRAGWRSYDLAGFDWATKWYDLDEEIWQAFLQGYREHRQLHEIDLQAIPVFTTVRHFYTLGLQACYAENTGVTFIDSQYLDRHLKFLKVCTAFWG